jgi:hypothetical protein
MGLDMFFYTKTSEGVSVEVGYQRKANAIHNWIVKNVQGGVDECQESILTQEKIQELADVIWMILTRSGGANPEQDLPTASGFFFGNTDYTSGYYGDLLNCWDILQIMLRKPEETYYYRASW